MIIPLSNAMLGFLILHSGFSLIPVPYTITQQILRYLHLNIRTLATSAAVCKSWAVVSRQYLKQRYPGRRLASSALSLDASGDRARTLYIRGISTRHFESSLSKPFDVRHSLAPHPLQSVFSTVTTLSISDSHLSPIDTFIIFVSRFSALQNIVFDGITFDDMFITTNLRPFTTLSTVTSITFRNLPLNQLFLVINRFNILENVTRINIHPVDQWDLPQSAKFIHRVSQILEYLSVGFVEDPEKKDDYVAGIIPVAPPTHLQHGSFPQASTQSNIVRDRFRRDWGLDELVFPMPKLIEVRVEGYFDVTRKSMQFSATFWTPRFIATMMPLNLQRFELGLRMESTSDMREHYINWELLDSILTSSDYPSLKEVAFCVDDIDGDAVGLDSLRNMFSRALPLLSARGALTYRYNARR